MTIDETIFEEYMAVNAIPAIKDLLDCLEKGKTNNLGSLTGEQHMRARRLMWYLNTQMHGIQITTLDMHDEWNELERDFHRKKEAV
jgi:hypothetical protein